MSRLVTSNKCPVAHGIAVIREVPLEVFAVLIKEINDNSTESEEPAADSRSEGESHTFCTLREFRVPHRERELIAKVHNELAGHHGVANTFDKLVPMRYHWEQCENISCILL